jgi:hypothetical protein
MRWCDLMNRDLETLRHVVLHVVFISGVYDPSRRLAILEENFIHPAIVLLSLINLLLSMIFDIILQDSGMEPTATASLQSQNG